MTRQRKLFIWTVIVLTVLGVAGVTVRMINTASLRNLLAPVSLVGAVLRDDDDPRKQTPLANVRIMAVDGSVTANAKSDSSGLFNLTIRHSVYSGRQIALTFLHPDYEPLATTAGAPVNRLYIVRMRPLVRKPLKRLDNATTPTNVVHIKDVRVRYLFKDEKRMSVGTLAKQFEVHNIGNVPCRNRQPCSPDGKWKAAANTLALDAEEGNEFQNIRVSCIAGPCPFTKIEPDDLSHAARKISIAVLNWSDTTGFLVEADVTRIMAADVVRYSYPFIVGQTMDFALPAGSEGLSIEANLDGQAIVFPLGPDVLLPWATCSVEIPAGGNKLFRCEGKPGYQVEQ